MPYTMPTVPGWASGQQANQNAVFEYFMSNMEQFDKRFREALYPDLYWQKVIPSASIDTGINPGAQSMSYPTLDWRGMGGWRARYGKNVPTVSFVTGKNMIPIQSGAISGLVDVEEVEAVQYGVQMDLRTMYPEIMRKACERHVEGTFFYGDSSVGFLPFLDFPGVPYSVVQNGTSGNTEWTSKTPDEILADLNFAMLDVWVLTRMVHMPNTFFMPPAQYGYISATPRSSVSETTILEYFLKNNICKNQGRGEVQIIPLPYLDHAGVSGAARMIVCERDAKNFIMPFPRRFEMLAPQYIDYTVKLYARYRFGPVNLVYPKAFLYVDGI